MNIEYIEATTIPDSTSDLIEEWIPVRGYEGLYEVSSKGRIRSFYISRNRKFTNKSTIIKGSLAKNGYRKVTLYKDGCMKSLWLHRVILESFKGPCPKHLEEAAHLDGDHTNNEPDNLEWVTRKENQAHKVKHGTHNRGERCGTSKLTSLDVEKIKILSDKGITQQIIANIFEVGQGHISRIINNKEWYYENN